MAEYKNFSCARQVGAHQIEVIDLNCQLEVIDPLPSSPFHIGLRAHHAQFLRMEIQSNTVWGWLTRATETRHKLSLYIKLQSPPTSPYDYTLQAEVYLEKWDLLKTRGQSWQIRLKAFHLMPITK